MLSVDGRCGGGQVRGIVIDLHGRKRDASGPQPWQRARGTEHGLLSRNPVAGLGMGVRARSKSRLFVLAAALLVLGITLYQHHTSSALHAASQQHDEKMVWNGIGGGGKGVRHVIDGCEGSDDECTLLDPSSLPVPTIEEETREAPLASLTPLAR